MNSTFEQTGEPRNSFWDYAVLASMKMAFESSEAQVSWQPYQVYVAGSLEVKFEKVRFKQEPRYAQCLQELAQCLQELKAPSLKRSLVNLAARHVVEEHLFTPFKACDFCGDRVVCEMEERCLK